MNFCSLCGIQAKRPLIEGKELFCCGGCRAVFRILETRNEAFHPQHPLYQEALKANIISNPELKTKKIKGAHTERLTCEIAEMGCPSCADVIGYLLMHKDGIYEAKIDYATDLALIDYDPKKIGPDQIFESIKGWGYKAERFGLKSKNSKILLLRLGIAVFVALNLMMLTYPLYFSSFLHPELAVTSFLLTLPVVFFSALPFYVRAYHALKVRVYGMDLLITIGVLSCFILSTYNILIDDKDVYYDTLAVIVTFLLFGKWIEAGVKESSKDRFFNLLRHVPQKVRTEMGHFILLKEVKKGDSLLFSLGELIPLKVKIKKGEGWFQEQAITGENTPKFYKEGDLLDSGLILQSGSFTAIVQETYEESLIHKLVIACDRHIEKKHDAFLQAFVPFVILLGIVAGYFNGFEAALSTLLIACPCAIGLATPLVRSKVIRLFADNGAILRNMRGITALANATLYVFDKTGTVTKGSLTFVKEPLNKVDLKGLSLFSHHPLAKVFSQLPVEGACFDKIEEYPGKGIIGFKKNVRYIVGSPSFLNDLNIENPFVSLKTHVLFVKDDQVQELIEFEDSYRENLDLPSPRVLLSGDQKAVVWEVAKKLHFDEWHAEKNPLEKMAYIQAKNETVVFVGDGLNDAPSLSASHCGIAMGDSLSLTQASADILLTHENLSVIKSLIEIAKQGERRIKQNRFWAFFYNVLAIPLAFMGILNPLIATAIMILSSVVVIGNSIRRIT
jgi:cation transport ATPase